MTLDVTEALSSDTTNHRHHHDHHLDMTLDVTEALSIMLQPTIAIIMITTSI